MKQLISIALILISACGSLWAQVTNQLAPGAPGKDAHWPTAAKTGFGTANSLKSKVWFTLADGVLTEVYYPTLDVPNVQTLQLVIVRGGEVDTEAEDTHHHIELVDDDSLSFRQVNTAKSGDYKIIKTYTTDPLRNTVLIDIEFQSSGLANVYLYYDPSLNNSGLRDTALAQGDALLSVDGDKASALISSSGFAYLDQKEGIFKRLLPTSTVGSSNGFLGVNDGLTELRRNRFTNNFLQYSRAENGNVVQVVALHDLLGLTFEANRKTGTIQQATKHCTLALAFGKTTQEALLNARQSLIKGFVIVQREYQLGWKRYVSGLPTVGAKYQRQFNMAAMVLHAVEDKTYRGATIASPSIPWGGGPNANEPTVSGYHGVWSRDLYHVATALDAMGDRAGANRALDYLFKRQQMRDGSFPQNSWVDGRPIGGGRQMDQVALPIVLALQLRRTDRVTWLHHIKKAADYLIRHGPRTDQERWEEKSGYSPSTLAAEIAALVCAARIAELNNDRTSAAAYLARADNWSGNVERWTATKTGPLGDGAYYLRISENDDPNDGAKLEINSGGGTFDEREIVDAVFLELVRLGIRGADDPLVLKSLAVFDQVAKVKTPYGEAWYRYNHDAYGERSDGRPYDGRTGKGRLWTLLTGERGQFELARGNRKAAQNCLDALMQFANAGRMIPEQIWDREQTLSAAFRFGEGTGSATPLAWSMGQCIGLAI